eukprot:gene5324-6469_t
MIGKNTIYLYILEGLKAGSDIIWIDCDAVFLKHPLPMVRFLHNTVDVTVNLHFASRMELNAGVGFVRASRKGIDVFNDTWYRLINETLKMVRKEPSHNMEQMVFSDVVETLLGDKQSTRLTSKENKNPKWGVGSWDPEATNRLRTATSTRTPLTYNNFTFMVVPDSLIGWKETLYDLYKEKRLRHERPTVDDLPTIAHVRGFSGGKVYDKVRHLMMLGYWYVGFNAFDIYGAKAYPDEHHPDKKSLRIGRPLRHLNLTARKAVTVFAPPHFLEPVCYAEDGYTHLFFPSQREQEARELCHLVALYPFSVQEYQGGLLHTRAAGPGNQRLPIDAATSLNTAPRVAVP